jgi:hypothetical protein
MMERDMDKGLILTDGATSQEATCTEKNSGWIGPYMVKIAIALYCTNLSCIFWFFNTGSSKLYSQVSTSYTCQLFHFAQFPAFFCKTFTIKSMADFGNIFLFSLFELVISSCCTLFEYVFLGYKHVLCGLICELAH